MFNWGDYSANGIHQIESTLSWSGNTFPVTALVGYIFYGDETIMGKSTYAEVSYPILQLDSHFNNDNNNRHKSYSI